MVCRSAQRRLAAFRPDDRIPTDLADHLSHCERCRTAFEDDRAVWDALSRYTVPTSRAPLVKAVLRRRGTGVLEWLFPSDGIPTRAFAASVAAVAVIGVAGGLWCGRTLIGLRLELPSPTAAAAEALDEAHILTAAPPGSLAAAYLEGLQQDRATR
jgi:hypothetical protein